MTTPTMSWMKLRVPGPMNKYLQNNVVTACIIIITISCTVGHPIARDPSGVAANPSGVAPNPSGVVDAATEWHAGNHHRPHFWWGSCSLAAKLAYSTDSGADQVYIEGDSHAHVRNLLKLLFPTSL
jgi:hypothetical protein